MSGECEKCGKHCLDCKCKMKFPVLIDWEEFVKENHCSLCCNWGFIDSRTIKTPAGFSCGKLNYCICPNGRKMKEVGWDIEVELLRHRPIHKKDCR